MEIKREIVAMNVRVARARKGLTASELAKRSGVGVTTISFIENAKIDTRLATLEKLAKVLDVSLEQLIFE